MSQYSCQGCNIFMKRKQYMKYRMCLTCRPDPGDHLCIGCQKPINANAYEKRGKCHACHKILYSEADLRKQNKAKSYR